MSNGKEPISSVAHEYAKRHVDKVFAGRRGHGKDGVGSRKMTRSELSVHLAVAFEIGRSMEAGLSRVKS